MAVQVHLAVSEAVIEIREPLSVTLISSFHSAYVSITLAPISSLVLGNGYIMHNLDSRHIRSVLTLVFPLLLLTAHANAGRPLSTGDRAPDWILPDSQGRPVSFYEDSADQPAVLLFWATWCPNCAKLMPQLEKLRRELADKNIKFYALNIWEDADPIAHMRENNFNFTLLQKADMVAKRYHVRGTPGLFVVNADKSIRYIRDKNSSTPEIYDAVKAALSGEDEQP
jgi:cytochrome c biogenesis protein CcmG, thiol:disulfide interchange protein DsbE